MKATKPILAGEQIFNDYGPLPRSDLLRMYGYITDNYAQYDVVELKHDMLLEVSGKAHSHQDTIWLKRQRQLEELDIIDDGYAIPRLAQDIGNTQLQDAIPGQLHMILRALCAHDKDNAALKKPKDALTMEEAALLQSALTKKLSEYSSTIEADQMVLARIQAESGDLHIPSNISSRRLTMALQVRIGEKEILRDLISLSQNHIKRKSEDIAHLAANGSSKRKYNGAADSQSKKAARIEKSRR